LAEAETIALTLLQLSILLAAALLLMPVMQFRPQLFDFLSLSAIIALLARHHRRGSGMLWVAIPLIAVWSNLHGGFFIGLVTIGVYGVATMLEDLWSGRGFRRGLGILAITAGPPGSTPISDTACADTRGNAIKSILNPTTHYTAGD
jgi:hypothetical protein